MFDPTKFHTQAILSRDFSTLAKLISGIENQNEQALAVADELYVHTGKAHVLGITGMPGSGKSTLANQLVKALVDQGKTIAIIAIDPTSPFSGGAVLGDRIRFKNEDYGEKVYFRSMASRGHQGGISHATSDIIHVLDAAGFDHIIVETVGAGQLEVDIAYLVDTLLNVITPEAGDDIQAIKAGIMEIGDIFVINKCDLPGADRKFAQLTIMLQDYQPSAAELSHHGQSASSQTDSAPLTRGDRGVIPVLKTQAERGQGIDELVQKIQQHQQASKHKSKERRYRRELIQELQNQLMAQANEHLGQAWIEQGVKDLTAKKTSPRKIVNSILNSS